MNKRGQTEVITTILLILIVLAAVIIVWQVINRFVTKGGETITTAANCLDIKLDVLEAKDSGEAVKITRLSGGKDGDVTDIKILVNGAAATISAPTDHSLNVLDTKTYTVNAITANDKVEVAAVLAEGTVCNIADSITATA